MMQNFKRQRKQNWSEEELQVLHDGIKLLTRYKVEQIHEYCCQQLHGFDRPLKDVRKKIYNILQEDIGHEIRVKVRSQFAFGLLRLAQIDYQITNIEEQDQIISEICRFLQGVEARRVIQNLRSVKDEDLELVLRLMRDQINSRAIDFSRILDLLETDIYLDMLRNYRDQMTLQED